MASNLRSLSPPAPSAPKEEWERRVKLRVKSLRRACRWSQTECAVRAGITSATVYRYELPPNAKHSVAVPGWYPAWLEDVARELNVVVAQAIAEAA